MPLNNVHLVMAFTVPFKEVLSQTSGAFKVERDQLNLLVFCITQMILNMPGILKPLNKSIWVITPRERNEFDV